MTGIDGIDSADSIDAGTSSIANSTGTIDGIDGADGIDAGTDGINDSNNGIDGINGTDGMDAGIDGMADSIDAHTTHPQQSQRAKAKSSGSTDAASIHARPRTRRGQTKAF